MKILIGIGVIILLQLLGLALCSANGRRKEEEEDWFKHVNECDTDLESERVLNEILNGENKQYNEWSGGQGE